MYENHINHGNPRSNMLTQTADKIGCMRTSFACGFTSIEKEEQYFRCAHYATLRKKNTFEKYQNIFNIYFQQILFVQSKVIVKKYVRKVSFITFG